MQNNSDEVDAGSLSDDEQGDQKQEDTTVPIDTATNGTLVGDHLIGKGQAVYSLF